MFLPCHTGTCFIQKIYASSSSLLQGKYLPFSPSPLCLNIFRLFVILLLTQLYRYTPEIFLFSTVTFKYTYRAPLRRIGQEYSANVSWSTFQSLKRIQPLPVRSKGVKPIIHQSELRTYAKVVPFKENSSFRFVVLWQILNGME
jgi:hypothetical protein